MKTTQTSKIDLFKENRSDYAALRKPTLVDTTPGMYLAIDGKGRPGGPAFEERIGALYGVAFTIKMTRKFAGLQDYAVSKLEAQWWADKTMDLSQVPQDQWQWKLLIRTPECVGASDLKAAVDVLLKRGKGAAVTLVQLERLAEGKCVQMLHVGPYEKECESIALMKEYAQTNSYCFAGRHHEIYISDPRRVPPERLKTILREPVIAAATA